MLESHLIQIQSYGVRRLLILSGEYNWCCQEASRISQIAKGDWLYLSNTKQNAIPFTRAQTLLGREHKHAIFDAYNEFHAEAFAALTGTLAAGSLLILIIPKWEQWSELVDQDSLRWSEQSKAIATPNFISHLQHTLLADPAILFCCQGQWIRNAPLPVRDLWTSPSAGATIEQQRILNILLRAEYNVYALIAERGRGKSTVAGMLAATLSGEEHCLYTAPNKQSTEVFQHWAKGRAQFIASDALFALCEKGNLARFSWLIIDEAATLPAFMLNKFIKYFPNVLLTTTVHGYEGTGRGFALKFCAEITDCQLLSLKQPIRWANNDPLENLISKILLMDAEEIFSEVVPREPQSINSISSADFMRCPQLLIQYYGLLAMAHYRTSPLDLRRLLDASNMQLAVIQDDENNVVGAIWSVFEGGLSEKLADEIWAGIRRPRGSLLAQSLTAHAGEPDAALMRSMRISRIAVHHILRRQGLARQLVYFHRDFAVQTGLDFLSVSFGYTKELWLFWQSCGFSLVHIGTQKEASSGCYSAMAIIPLTEKAKVFVKKCGDKLQRNWYWQQSIVALSLAIKSTGNRTLLPSDWFELAGFAYAHRSPEAARASLCRLLLNSQNKLPTLTAYFTEQISEETIIRQMNYSGKKELLNQCRIEASEAMASIDFLLSLYWKNKVMIIINNGTDK